MKSDNFLGFDPEVSKVILKVLEGEIKNSKRFGVLEQKIFFKLKPFLNLPLSALDATLSKLENSEVQATDATLIVPFDHFRFFQKLEHNLKILELDCPHEQMVLRIAILMECHGVGESSKVQRYLFHLEDPNRTIDSIKFERVMQCCDHENLPKDEKSFLQEMVFSDWLEEYQSFCASQDSISLQMRLQKSLGFGSIKRSLVEGFANDYQLKQGQLKYFNVVKMLFLLSLAFFSFGVINHLLQILQTFNLFVYAVMATIAWIGYLCATGYLLRIAWIRSGFSSKDNFMTEMLRSYNLHWIKADNLTHEQCYRFMNIYFGERMRERSRNVKESMKFLLNKAIRKNGYEQWLDIINYSRLGFVLGIYRELARHSDLIESQASQRAEDIKRIQWVNYRAQKILDKAKLIGGKRTDKFINVDDIDSITEDKIYDFQQQVQLTLDYLEGQEDLGINKE